MEQLKTKGRVNNVQLAAVTVDGYKPELLIEVNTVGCFSTLFFIRTSEFFC